VAFGTNPGKATVMATLRTFYDKDMDILTRKAEALANKLAKDFSIKTEISYTEVFPATINDAKALES
jgi:metal-dependent amidase/aminoacylase/carboxypeptidase family protein